MKLETFFERFELCADLPVAVARLRALICQLAVQGRLVEHDLTEESANLLLKRIRAERAALPASRRSRKATTALELDEVFTPFAAPPGWMWTSLGNVQIFTNGYAFKSEDYQPPGVGIIRMGELGANGEVDERNMKYVSSDIARSLPEIFRVNPGDLLMGMSGSIGKLAINRSDKTYLLNQRVGRLEPILIEKGFLYLFLKTVELHYLRVAFGMAIKNLSTRQINETPFPLPPLAEQKRIVAKVDELMALCDRLEAQQQERKTRHAALARASLARFADAPTPVNLQFLFHPSYTISPADLRKSILTLAVQGRLVPQDPNDEPALKSRKIDADLDFLPNWLSGSVFDLAALKSGNSFPNEEVLEEGEYFYVKVSDMNLPENQHEITTSSRFINPGERDLRRLIPAGSIIFPKRGGAIATNKKRLVRKPIFVDSNTMAMICPPFIELRYLHIWFKGIDLWKLNTGTSVPQVNNKDIGPLVIPVPPLPEQRRIVAKVDQLMALVDELETQLSIARKTGKDLREALIAELTAPPN
jgi:type I restriction enzyme S subunit